MTYDPDTDLVTLEVKPEELKAILILMAPGSDYFAPVGMTYRKIDAITLVRKVRNAWGRYTEETR